MIEKPPLKLPKCQYCADKDASRLYYYSKTYQSGKDTLESPILCCDDCSPKARQDLSICRGGIEGVHVLPFKELAKMSEKQIGFFCSKKGKESNHLANKPWRQLIFRIRYLSLPPKKGKESYENLSSQ